MSWLCYTPRGRKTLYDPSRLSARATRIVLELETGLHILIPVSIHTDGKLHGRSDMSE